MAHQLSPGAIEEIFWKGATGSGGSRQFVLQVMDVKKISNTGTQAAERYRLTVSDGRNFCQAMLATQLNRLVTDKQVEKFGLIQVQECICNVVQNRRIVILLNIEPKGSVNEGIGNPVSIESSNPSSADPSTVPTVKGSSQGTGRSAPMSSDANPAKLNFTSPDGAGNVQAPAQKQWDGGDQVKQEFNSGGGGGGGGNFDGGSNRGGGMSDGGNQGRGGYGGGGGFNNNSNNNLNNQGRGGGGGGGYQGGNNNNNNFNNSNNYNNNNQGGGGGYQGGRGGGGGGGGGYNSSSYNQGGHDGSYGGGGGGSGNYGDGGGSSSYNNSSGARGTYNQGPGGGAGGNQGGRGRGGVVERDQGETGVRQIMDLNSFNGTGWSIIARVTVKGTVRTYKNAKGEGRVGSIDMMDGSGDIKGTFFNDDCDKWMSTLMVNTVYKIRGGMIKPANAQFNNCSSQVEITFGRDTVFEPLSDAAAPKVTYNFIKIDAIEQVDPGQRPIDILALVQRVDPVSNITVKTGANAGNQVAKREILLVDQSLKTIKMTLWDENINLVDENAADAPVIAVKGARVSDFGGRSLSMARNSMVEMNPDMPAAHALKGWYVNGGKAASFSTLSGGGGGSGKDVRKFIADIKGDNLGHGEKPDYFSMRVWVTYFKHDGTFCYVANPENKRKVVQQGDNWYDESQNKVIDNPERRYVLSLSASDHTGSTWLSAFNDEGLQLLNGTTADQLNEWKDSADQRFDSTFHAATFQPYIFKARAKAEMWQDESRVKCTVTGVAPLDFKVGSSELLNLIREYQVPVWAPGGR